jgi:RNA polymerase sigma-70 factor (ECF subfamily)
MLRRFFFVNAEDDAEELIHTTIVELSEARHRYAGRASFRSFVLGVARNVLFEYYRARKKQYAFDPEESRLQDLSPTPTVLLAKEGERRLLGEALRMIPLDDQITLALRFWEDMTVPEISTVLGCPPNTAKNYLRRARLRLEEALARLEAEPGLLSSTRSNLDKWLASLQHQIRGKRKKD